MTLAPYATHPDQSRGRLIAEGGCRMRNPHQRDRDRIVHSAAFRRLEYKTQVFVNHEGDHYRTRLTHSLEVAQMTRSLCRALKLNEDLGEALALAHDLGHTPFGHAGEDALHAAMKPFDGFDHNAQSLRILTRLEQRYADFDGLNLSWETLEGIAKHNGPLVGEGCKPLPRALKEYSETDDLEFATHAGLEAQLAALSDDIAYNNHDMEDGLRAGFFRLEDIADLPLVSDAMKEVKDRYPSLSDQRMRHEVIRRVISQMIYDLEMTTRRNIEASGVKTVDEVRALGRPLAAFSPEMQVVLKSLKSFLMKHMYRHYRVNRMMRKASQVIEKLFEYFLLSPESLPPEWYAQTAGAAEQMTAETVADYIAGMTDRFALEEYRRVFDVHAHS